MKTVAAKLYEGMFLVDSAVAASDWQGVNDRIRSIMEKVGAEIVSMNKWDERKLAYDIMGKSRGTYILAYFRVDGSKIAGIERAVQLSEDIMRVLVLSVEDIDQQHLSKETPATAVQSQAPEQAQAPSDEPVDVDRARRPESEELGAEVVAADESFDEPQEDKPQ